MSTPRRDYLVLWLRLYFAAHLLYSSLRYFTLFEPQPQVPGLGGQFIDVLTAMGIFPFVKALEGAVGIALLFNRFVPAVLLIELPVSVNIFWLNFFIVGRPRQLFSGLQEIVLNLIMIAAYWRSYAELLRLRSLPSPLWARPVRGSDAS
jgi:hypothetical protein